MADTVATVVVPAHNEERSIGRLLDALSEDGSMDGAIAVFVIANGCSDRTAAVVRSYAGVQLIELEEGNKQKAMRAGAAGVTAYPVVYADGDVVVRATSVRAIARALRETGALAAAPERQLDLDGASWVVRSYFRVWSALPQVRSGLFGRGVIALSQDGQRRVDALPMYLSDDLALSESFRPAERVIVPDATVVVRGPRRLADLLRRRQRIVMGTREFDADDTHRERTGIGTLVDLAREQPRLTVHVPTFVAVTIASRLQLAARRRRSAEQVWLRDESSRAGP